MSTYARRPDGPEWLLVLVLFAMIIAAILLLPGCAAVQAKAETKTEVDANAELRAELNTRFELMNRQVAAIGSNVSDQQQEIRAVASKIDASTKNFDPLTMYLTVGGLVSIVLADRYLPLLATLWRRKPRPTDH